MIEYNPEDVTETNDYAPWEKGNYESEIIEADKMQSKAGNDMIRLNQKLNMVLEHQAKERRDKDKVKKPTSK